MRLLYPTSVLLAVYTCLILSACGSNSSGNTEKTEDDGVANLTGTWSGVMQQISGISCSDGTFLGAGLGSELGSEEFVIEGADSIDEPGVLELWGCTHTGVRVENDEIVFDSEDPDCPGSVKFYDIEEGRAQVITQPEFADTPPAQGLNCKISLGGEIILQ